MVYGFSSPFTVNIEIFHPNINTGRFIMLSVITSIYNKKTPNPYAEPSALMFSTSIAP
jgi:hypothetical protein